MFKIIKMAATAAIGMLVSHMIVFGLSGWDLTVFGILAKNGLVSIPTIVGMLTGGMLALQISKILRGRGVI